MTTATAAATEPNVNFGAPAIFYDSHPHLQPSYIGSCWEAFKGTMHIAWSGIVPKRLWPGTLRLVWWTVSNSQAPARLNPVPLTRSPTDGQRPRHQRLRTAPARANKIPIRLPLHAPRRQPVHDHGLQRTEPLRNDVRAKHLAGEIRKGEAGGRGRVAAAHHE